MKNCDGCGLCCKLLSVPELDKPACQWCPKIERHAVGRRCGIYAERPDACRTFMCLWLLDAKMQPGLRPDRCHVVFATDEYVDGPFVADEPWLHAHVDPVYPQAWQRGLPAAAISAFLARGGSVAVHVGAWWQTFHKGEIRSGHGDVEYGLAVGMFRGGELPAGISPLFTPDKVTR